MELCEIIRIGPDRSVPISPLMRDCLGFQDAATAYYYFVESTYYTEGKEEHKEYRLIISSILPQIWEQLYDLEFLLGDEPGAFSTLVRMLAKLGIATQLGESRTRLWRVRSAVTLTAWFKQYEGTIGDLDHEFRKQIRDQPHLRQHIKPIQTEGDTEIWVRGEPSALQEITFEREFSPGLAGLSGHDVPIFLPPTESFSVVQDKRLRLPEFVIKKIDDLFGLPTDDRQSIAGSGYVIANVDLGTKLISMTFPDPEANVVKVEFHTEDEIGVLAGLTEVLSAININLLETKLVTLEFSRHAMLQVIADVSTSPLARVSILDMEREFLAFLKRKGVRLYGTHPIIVQDIVGRPNTAPEHVEAFRVLNTLEMGLRNAIRLRLSELTPGNWWLDRIPPDVRDAAQERAQQQELEKASEPVSSEDLLDYVDFSSYVKILLRKNNWNDAFAKYFPTKEWLKTHLEELEPIRNSITHGRSLTGEDVERLELYARDVLGKLRDTADTPSSDGTSLDE